MVVTSRASAVDAIGILVQLWEYIRLRHNFFTEKRTIHFIISGGSSSMRRIFTNFMIPFSGGGLMCLNISNRLMTSRHLICEEIDLLLSNLKIMLKAV